MISKEALEEIKQVSEMYPDGIHKRQEIETFTRWQDPTIDPTIEEKDKEIERLNNIIKEVREYIEKMEKLHFDYSYEKQELLEILKGSDK